MEIKPVVRDSNGLIEGVNYVRTPEGLIDWRKMIPIEFLVPNKRRLEKDGKAVPESVEGLEDKYLLILLGGIKRLARLRGFTKVEYPVVVAPSAEYVTTVCRIEWIPNFETEGKAMVHSAQADAHPGNTDGFGKIYLAAISQNRAFVRAVREFLNIDIAGQDEVNDKDTYESAPVASTNSYGLLEQLMLEKKVSFEELKSKLEAEKFEGAASFGQISDIPKAKVFELIERLRRKK